MKERYIIGTRGSKLALAQAEIIKEKLIATHTQAHIDIRVIKTEGDSNLNPIPLDTMGKGWFTKEIEKELLDERIDIAVHSLKDLPEQLPEGLAIRAFCDREDSRDVLVSQNNHLFKDMPPRAVVGTDSLRRKVQILDLRSDITVKSIRGNITTRLEKLDRGEYDAIAIASAGLIRLGLKERIAQYFSIEEIMPAPGQGILAIEIRAHDTDTNSLIQHINDIEVEAVATAERTFSAQLGGGCKTPIGAHASIAGKTLTLSGMYADSDGVIARETYTGTVGVAEMLGKELAEKIKRAL